MFPVVFANTHLTAGAEAGIKVPPQHFPSLAPALFEFTPITVRLFSRTVIFSIRFTANRSRNISAM